MLEMLSGFRSNMFGAHAVQDKVWHGCGVRFVNCVGSRFLVVVAAWLGLAMLDMGPRAAASFCPTLSPQSRGEISAGSSSEIPTKSPAVWPPEDFDQVLLKAFWSGLAGSESSSTGTAGGVGSPGSVPPALGASSVDVENREFGAFLRAQNSLQLPPPHVSSIFEPPR